MWGGREGGTGAQGDIEAHGAGPLGGQRFRGCRGCAGSGREQGGRGPMGASKLTTKVQAGLKAKVPQT